MTLSIEAHDPDCAGTCTSGCGLTIQGVSWFDDTARVPPAFQNAQSAAPGSPWNASVTWIAPPAEGMYRISAQLLDSGTMMCGGKKSTTATLTLTVTNTPPPVIDSFSVSPPSLAVGATAELTVVAHDPAGRILSYGFSADAGQIAQTGTASPTARWTAPQTAGPVTLHVQVATAGGPSVSASTTANVLIGSFVRTLSLPGTRGTRVAPLPDGRIAVVDGTNGTLQLTTPTGAKSWMVNDLSTPVAVAYAGGELFVLERAAARVSVWDLTGTRVRAFPIVAVLPNGIAAGPNPGEIAVSDTSGGRISIVSALDGRFLRAIGAGVLVAPTGLATSNGRLAVADSSSGQVRIFDVSGAVTATLGDPTLLVRPQGLAWDAANTRVVVSDAFSGEITILGEDGSVRGMLGGFGTAAGQIVNPIDVALLPGGLLAVTTAAGDIPLYQLLNSLPPVAPPAGVTAADRGNDDGGAIIVTWTASKDDPPRVAAYIIERAVADSTNFNPVGRSPSGTTSFADTTTTDGICYHYQVAATDGATENASSPTACAYSRNDLPPPAPATIAATVQTPWGIRLAWSGVAAADLAGYQVEVSSAGATRTLKTDRSTTSLLVDSLQPDTSYSLTVRAFDVALNLSPAASATAKTYPDATPPAPTAVTVTDAATGGAAEIRWTQPETPVPVASYTVTFRPSAAGWPAITVTSTTTSAHAEGLVNQLSYSVTVTGSTPWGRTSDPSAAQQASVTAPPRSLPVVSQAGWDGTTGISDAAGITIAFSTAAVKRELRFEYRSNNAELRIYLDGAPLPSPFADTLGAWAAAVVDLDQHALHDGTTTHKLELRNASFPDFSAQLAFRRIDFVPLRPKKLKTEKFNTVVDVTWEWQEARSDLIVTLLHAPASGDDDESPTAQFTPVVCKGALLGRCRDPFVPNGQKMAYRFSIASPAGWATEVEKLSGRAQFDELPPPVTDLSISTATRPDSSTAIRLDWTPVSTALTKNAAPSAISFYRIYRQENGATLLLAETPAPPFLLPSDAFDPARQKLVVRSVDAQGRESR